MKKLTSKILAVAFIETMIIMLSNHTKMLTKALAVRHGLKVPAMFRKYLALELVSMANIRWTMELLSGSDARLEKKLAKLDKRLRWASEAFGLLMVEVEDREKFIGDPDAFFGNSWWDFIKKGHRFSDPKLSFLAEGPRKLKDVGVGWYFWEVFGHQEIAEMEARLEAEARQAFEAFKAYDESVWEDAH